MSEWDVAQLSRLQFALTALYHFLFVPLTLGLSWLLAIMESVWVMTRRPVWRDMTKFWGKLFGINFAMGVATGITMEFQFGTNWAYYSHFVGDIFGAPLALEGLTAFFLESTFVGLFFFGWDKVRPLTHLMVTWAVALGSSLSALWILIANGWMQNPVGAAFNPVTMRMELTSLTQVIFNPVAQAKFVHTVSGGYVTGAMFVLSLSAWFLLRRRHVDFAKRSFAVAAAFGTAAALSSVVLGDESGYLAGRHQKMKIAALEAMWDTEPAPAAFTLFGIPDQQNWTTHGAVRIPWLLGLIATRSVSEELPGIRQLVAENEARVRSGILAVDALERLRADPDDAAARQALARHGDNLGFGLLLRRYVDDPRRATPDQIRAAARDTVPRVAPLFWSFRLMVACGFWFIVLFGLALWTSTVRVFDRRWLLRLALLSLPLPWAANELGWF
ncbi:MAG TPA: cytochrome ubiquinol oxidase subunit I, partial [Magnetospirillum sp.]|nr:cytochrome ubiquinol oxidase subunit I [Magnetospirillum sp.]